MFGSLTAGTSNLDPVNHSSTVLPRNEIPIGAFGSPNGGCLNMLYSERRRDHLKKAEEAKAQVARSIDPVAKKAWERIAASYQELANLAPGKEAGWHA